MKATSSLHQFLDYVTYAVFKKRNMPLKCLFGCMYKEQVFQGSKGQSSTRLLEVDFIMCRSLKLVLVFFLVMIMIEHSSSWVMIYRKLKPVEPLSSPLDHENKVRTVRIKKIVLIFNVLMFLFIGRGCHRIPSFALFRILDSHQFPSFALFRILANAKTTKNWWSHSCQTSRCIRCTYGTL